MRIIRKRTTVTGTDTTDATASAAEILAGETAYVNGAKVTGELVPLDTSDALAMKAAIEAKGGTVTMAGDAPTVAELTAGIGTIPGTPVSISLSATVPDMPTITEATA